MSSAGALQSVQEECYGLQKECALLRSEKQDLVNKQQKEKNALQSECAALRRDKEELQSEREATVQKQHQLEKELSRSVSTAVAAAPHLPGGRGKSGGGGVGQQSCHLSC